MLRSTRLLSIHTTDVGGGSYCIFYTSPIFPAAPQDPEWGIHAADNTRKFQCSTHTPTAHTKTHTPSANKTQLPSDSTVWCAIDSLHISHISVSVSACNSITAQYALSIGVEHGTRYIPRSLAHSIKGLQDQDQGVPLPTDLHDILHSEVLSQCWILRLYVLCCVNYTHTDNSVDWICQALYSVIFVLVIWVVWFEALHRLWCLWM